MLKNKVKSNNGITLVALVISIIILLILATISIQALTNTGLFAGANRAKLEAKRGQIKEWLSLNLFEVQTKNYDKTEEEILEIARQNTEKSEKLKKLGKTITVDDEISTEEDGEKVPPYYYVIVDDDLYRVSISAQEFIGEVGKIVPYVDFEATTTTKSIILKVTTKRNQGGKLEYYIKFDGSDYGEPVTTTDKEYTFDNLTQNKTYTVKVVAVSENGQKAEKEQEVTVGSIKELTASDIDFEYSVNGTIIDKKKWTNQSVKVTAKPKIDITGYTLVTKKENGKWETSDTQTFSDNGIMYVALSDGVNYGTSATANVTNIEKNVPSVEISLSSTETTTEGAITATVVQSDNQSGVNIGSCRWVYNTIAGNIGTNSSSYTGIFTSTTQNLTLSTTTVGTYYLHVLSTDNAGNTIETIKGPIVVKIPDDKVVPGAETHIPGTIQDSWEDLSNIAKIISNTPSITNDTAEATVTLNGTTRTLGVGDTTTVDGKTVRILGFNHDPLTDTSAYGEPTATGMAGISFEYVDFVTSNSAMDSSASNKHGWEATPLRTTLNRTVYDSLSIKNYIKAVNKEYIPIYDYVAKLTCSDKLWVLSCGEIWDNGYNGGNTRGYAMAKEGSQYKYYKTNLGSTSYSASTNVTKKPNTSSPGYWWLRSPSYNNSSAFCSVFSGGNCDNYYANYGSGVAPGFSI